ncbi:XRE family transcriptional regulator [Pontibacillus yanchengensis]|uniref:XRE family transcriptional regulator n=2 Tax=Pontibacillus yanchengensis TaxID=462910 RepID=A0ACC7VLJ2_9BACI|nr:XRE family transcriptional regulator [Pontibacillus yanchengensis]MYL35434.1 XRE family transcriptional regulator [Pontibacillus yanchengensis]MYL55853.1 XRE family transcriptional regulator [Pontibacillus yanchengensis]
MVVKNSRSKFGKFIDRHDIKLDWLSKKSKISKSTICSLANNKTKNPTMNTSKRIIRALREYDSTIRMDDLWD